MMPQPREIRPEGLTVGSYLIATPEETASLEGKKTGDTIQQRCFAGAIRPGDLHDLSRRQAKAQPGKEHSVITGGLEMAGIKHERKPVRKVGRDYSR